MINAPTQEQIKKFWEWCGFTDVNYNSLGAIGQKWSGRFGGVKSGWQYLDIDLNNLFKYAVPKLQYQVILKNIRDGWHCMLFNSEKERPRIEATNKDPALALFWAIWEAIRKLSKVKAVSG